MSFIYGDNTVVYDGMYLGEHVVWPVIYIKDYQKSWAWVHTDAFFDLWFEKGLKQASLNEQTFFDLEFGDGEHFRLFSFVKMLEKRIEKQYNM